MDLSVRRLGWFGFIIIREREWKYGIDLGMKLLTQYETSLLLERMGLEHHGLVLEDS